jgi:hypothetical protein
MCGIILQKEEQILLARKYAKLKRAMYMASGRLKGGFFVLIVCCILVVILYTQHLVGELRKDASQIVHFYTIIMQRIASDPIESEALGWAFENIIRQTTFPLVLADTEGNPNSWEGLDIPENDISPSTIDKVRRVMKKMAKENKPVPITHDGVVISYLYYGDSKLVSQLSRLPYVTLSSLSLLVLVAFLGFGSIKRSEQRFIWVGMAKETAHQLGTPISSLLGWMHILQKNPSDPQKIDTVAMEMESDIKRLEKVAARFSQIGSEAALTRQNIHTILSDVVAYIKRRLPQSGREFRIIENYGGVPPLPINRDLFEWAIENLIKNGIDAVKQKMGIIEIVTGELPDKGLYFIDVTDNGSGIKALRKNDIFKAGYSTKKRGWGLGLNLTKRIIEEYHGGKLFIKETYPGKGTTMRIVLYNES